MSYLGLYPTTNQSSYEDLLGQYKGELGKMPSTETGGYLSQLKVPTVQYPTMPAYSLGTERMYQQQYAAPQLSQLNQKFIAALTSAQNKPFPAQSYMTREALGGYGQGVSNIMAGALSPAHQMQMAELNAERQNLMNKYHADYANVMNQYGLDLKTALMKEEERRNLITRIKELDYKIAMSKMPTSTNYSSLPSSLKSPLMPSSPTLTSEVTTPTTSVFWGDKGTSTSSVEDEMNRKYGSNDRVGGSYNIIPSKKETNPSQGNIYDTTPSPTIETTETYTPYEYSAPSPSSSGVYGSDLMRRFLPSTTREPLPYEDLIRGY